MRKLLMYLFAFTALVVCLVRPSRAEAPELVVCNEGHCVMAEADFRRLQEMMRRAKAIDADNERAYWAAQREIASCMARLEGHKS